MDVGRGGGSCHTDCDCPLCAPYCSTSGFCQNHQRAGRTFCSQASTSTGPASTSTPACPPLPGEPAPPGCNKRFVEASGGDIPCQEVDDCPQSLAWWCDEWRPDDPDACDVLDGKLPLDVTMSRCDNNKCIFEADWRGVWVWCVDRNNNNTLRIVKGHTNDIKVAATIL